MCSSDLFPSHDTKGVAQTGIAGALGNWFGGMNDDRQYNQQQRLQELQLKGNKDMVNYNYAKQLEFWKQTNYSAQMEQMKLAGLNPALIYGSSGSGGTTGSATGGVTGASAPSGGGEALAFMNIAQKQQELKLLDAQKANIEADTKKKETETKNIDTEGIDY